MKKNYQLRTCVMKLFKESWRNRFFDFTSQTPTAITILVLALFSSFAIETNAQVNYSYGWEPAGLGSWATSGTGTFSQHTSGACTGTGVARANVYYNGTNTFASPTLGTSNGGTVTFSFNYKITQFTGGAAAAADLVQIDVQWANSTSGPWNTFHTINSANHVAATSCANVIANFVPGTGATYVRFQSKAIGADTDLYFFYDDISAVQGAAPTCIVPTAISGVPSSPTAADLSWVASTSNPSAGYEWEVRSSGAAGSGASGLAGSGTTAAGIVAANITTLTANTPYSLHVRSNCGGGDLSTWGTSTFTTPLSCFPPTALTATTISSTSANFSWTAPTTAPSSGYQWEVRSSGAGGSGATGLVDSGSTTAGITTATSAILTANSTYTLYVRSNCGAGDYTAWVASSVFVTFCNPLSVPYFEGFETGHVNQSAVANCLTQNSITGTQVWTANSSLIDYNRAPRTGSFNAYLRWSNEDWMFIPLNLTGGTTYRIKLYARQDGATAANANIAISYGTAGNAASMTNVVLPATGIINGTYQELFSDFSPAATGVYYIGIKGFMNGTPYYISLDDISVEVAPTDAPDYANLQYPATSTVAAGTPTIVYGQVYESGLTDVEPGLSGQAAGMEVWVGVNNANTNPNTWTNWTVATHNAAHISNNDEYQASIGATLAPGTYYYATRYRLNNGPYRYGGIDASGNGNFWDGTTFNSGILTVTLPANDECAVATSLVIDTLTAGTNAFATTSTETSATTCNFSSTTSKDVWYAVIVPSNVGRLNITTSASTPAGLTDTAIRAYRGICGNLVDIGCNDDISTSNRYSSLDLVNLIPGETILLRVWGYNGGTGTFNIRATVPATCSTITIWDGTSWSNGTPVAGMDVAFNGNYSGPGFEACAVNVNGTSQVVITSGSDLNLTGNVNVASTASLTLANDVNLVQSVTTANVGNVTIQRESAPMIRLDYTLWSSPVSGQNLYAFSPNTLTNRFYVYDTATDNYVTTGLSGTTTFAAGRGYGIRAEDNHPTSATSWMGAFTGVPRNGDQSFTMTNAGNGFNLVGNPYPSVIDATAFVTANSTRITGTLYFYAHTLGMLPDGTYPAGNNYALWNGTGSTAATAGTAGIPANVPNGKINVGQGFIVKRSGTGALAFNNGMREASHGTPFFRAADNTDKHRIWLNLTNSDNSAFSQMLVGYVDGATQAVDNSFDGESFGQVGSFIASKLDSKNFTIQGRALPFSDEDIVDVNFHAATAGNFTISLSQMDGVFAADQSVYIKDAQTGATHDLKAAPYSFVSNAGTFDGRFQIVYRSALSTPDQTFTPEAVIAFVKNNTLNVMTKNHEMKGITIYDLRGRLLFENNKINAENFIVPNFAPQNQVLLIQVTSQNNEVATVKVIF